MSAKLVAGSSSMVARRSPSMTVCPVCREQLYEHAIRCRGCSVILGTSGSERRFAPAFAPAGTMPIGAATVQPPRPRSLRVTTGLALFASAALVMFTVVSLVWRV